MYNPDSDDDILNCLKDVVKGFTVYNNKWFIKHLAVFEDNDVRSFYNLQMEELVDIPTREDQEAMLIDNGIWSKENESELSLLKVRIEAAKSTLENILIKSQRSVVEKQLEEFESRFAVLALEKHEYIGSVREDVANQNTCEFIVEKSFFIDEGLANKVFKNQDDLYEQSLEKVEKMKDVVFFIKALAGGQMCKKMACSQTFQSIISIIPKGQEYKLFQKPIIELTSNQISLIQYGQIFRSIMENFNVPEEIQNDPDKILEIPKQAKKIQEIQDKAQSNDYNTSYVGATSKEMKEMGMSGKDVFTLLKESGKESLGKDDLI